MASSKDWLPEASAASETCGGESKAMCSEEDLTALGRCDHGTLEMQASGLHLVLSEGSLLLAALTPALG